MLLTKKIRSWFKLDDKDKKGSGQPTKTLKQAVRKPKTSTKISYNSDLVPTLIGEHKMLLKLHGEIIDSAKREEHQRTKKLLVKFKNLLVGHLLKENTSLYTYLKHSLSDPSSSELATGMKQEMDGIAQAVMQFIKTALEDDYVYDENFISEFSGIGAALVNRIESEENSLYLAYEKHA